MLHHSYRNRYRSDGKGFSSNALLTHSEVKAPARLCYVASVWSHNRFVQRSFSGSCVQTVCGRTGRAEDGWKKNRNLVIQSLLDRHENWSATITRTHFN